MPSSQDAANQAALVSCVGGTNTATHRTGQAHSPDYKLDASTISSDASSFVSEADIDADIAMLRSPKIDACYSSLLRQDLQGSLEKGETIKATSIKITPGAGKGPSNVVATGTGLITVVLSTASGAPVTAASKTVNIYADVTFIKGPNTEAEVDAIGIGQPVPATIVTPLVTAVANRAAKS